MKVLGIIFDLGWNVWEIFYNKNFKISSEGRRLHISSTTIADAGTYICEASNRAGQVVLKFHLEILCTNLATEFCRELENRHIESYRLEYERRKQLDKLRQFQSPIRLVSNFENPLKINLPRNYLKNTLTDYSVTIGYLLSTPKPFGAPYLHASHVQQKFYPKKERSYRYFLTKPENTTDSWIRKQNVTQYSDNVYIQNVKAKVSPIKNSRHWVKSSNRVRKFKRKFEHQNYFGFLNSLVEF